MQDQLELLYTLPEASGVDAPCGYVSIRPGNGMKTVFRGSEIGFGGDRKRKYRLRMTGEVDMYFSWRNEGGFPSLYTLIDDALCSAPVHNSQFSLKLSSEGDDYARRAYYKTSWPPRVMMVKGYEAGGWKFGIWVKKEQVSLLPGGHLDFVAELYYKREGRHPADISDDPDLVYKVSLGEDSSDWEQVSLPLSVEPDVACILVYMSAENFTGTAWVEDPLLINSAGHNMLPPFAPSKPYMRHLNWLGHNLSKKEWPKFEIRLNNTVFFEGELFQRIYRWPVNEIDIPSDLLQEGDNELSIRLISDYREALPFKVKKLEFVGLPDEVLTIIACPEIAVVGEPFSILISTAEEGVEAKITAASELIQSLEKKITFEKAGLNVIQLKALKAGVGAEIKIDAGGTTSCCAVERLVERETDYVVTGTGDAIYINQNLPDMEYFLAWYLHHQIGNSITFRPVYRWSGSRVLNKQVWKRLADLCNRMGLFYSHMIDGRELPGSSANPDRKLLAGPYFMGAQLHEKEGNYWYWGSRPIERDEEFYMDIWSRLARDKVITQFPRRCPVRTKNGAFNYFDPYGSASMAEAAQQFVDHMKFFTQNATRHTGPSVGFKYLYQAGFEWLGAELMYSTHEVGLSALRGASRAYGKDDYGAHLAVQWSTTPHDSPQRYRRYDLALFLCYMHGVRHINTEEGLWKIEEMYAEYERFDTPCLEHKEIQKKFLRFVQTHSRRGTMRMPMAFLSGKYDGWNCFGRQQVWGQSGEDWKFGPPEESWDLINVFYPLSVLDTIYKHPCPNEPQGYYTGTPYGPVDILPIEARRETMGSYRILAFLGWNTAEPDQIDKLLHFIKNGGTLILGWPHLFTSDKRPEALGDHPQVLDNEAIGSLIGGEFHGFIDARMNGSDIKAGGLTLHTAVPLVHNEDRVPLVIENRVGAGKVIFVNVKAYPAEKSVKDLYAQLFRQAGESVLEAERGRGWLQTSSHVGFTVYDGEGLDPRRTIYFVNVDWWSEQSVPAEAQLLWGESNIALRVYRERMNILSLWESWAVWTHDNETDIIGVQEEKDRISIKLQGMGTADLIIFHKTADSRQGDLFVLSDQLHESVPSGAGGWHLTLQLNGPVTIELNLRLRETGENER